MYRQAIKMEQERIANDHFITRLGSLPVVNSAWNQACGMYQKTKESNGLIRATCNVAETGVQTMYSTAAPVMEKYQPQIEQVNSFACQKLALMEENYPVITKPTDELWKDGQERCTEVLKPITVRVNTVKDTYNGMMSRGYETVDAAKGKVGAVKDYGISQVSRTLETPVARFALEKVNEALTLSEEYIEKYLPEGDVDTELKEVDEVEIVEANTLNRVTTLSTKLRQRLFRRAMKDLNGLQVRSKEKLEGLNFTVDLIQYAKERTDGMKGTVGEKYDFAQKRVMDIWDQINQEADEDDMPETMEERTIVVARRLTHHVKQGLTTVSGYVPTRMQPQAVRERLENARKYTEELYMSFKEAKSYDDIPTWMLNQTRDKMVYVTETVGFLWETFLVSPINWMVPSLGVGPKPGEIENNEMEVELEPVPSAGRSVPSGGMKEE